MEATKPKSIAIHRDDHKDWDWTEFRNIASMRAVEQNWELPKIVKMKEHMACVPIAVKPTFQGEKYDLSFNYI